MAASPSVRWTSPSPFSEQNREEERTFDCATQVYSERTLVKNSFHCGIVNRCEGLPVVLCGVLVGVHYAQVFYIHNAVLHFIYQVAIVIKKSGVVLLGDMLGICQAFREERNDIAVHSLDNT